MVLESPGEASGASAECPDERNAAVFLTDRSAALPTAAANHLAPYRAAIQPNTTSTACAVPVPSTLWSAVHTTRFERQPGHFRRSQR